jgi:CBS domain-containing protein
MVQKSIGALVVTEKKPVGIITERDIMRVCCPDASCTKTKVEEIMSKPLVTVDADTPIGAAVQLMTRKNIRRLLVTEKDEIIGIVTERDLMRGTLEALHALNYSVDLI